MYLEGKYLLLSYRDMPDIDFICQCDSDLRIKVSKMKKGDLQEVPTGLLCGTADKWILIFENISNRIIEEQEEILRAVHWYKCKLGLQSMNLLYI